MKSHRVKIKRKRQVAKDTLAIETEKPADFIFKPGDQLALEVVELKFPDSHPNWRSFSVASAPHDDHLLFVTRQGKSGFKKTLAALQVGDELILSEPEGIFNLPEVTALPIYMFAGGVGISTFRSMIKHAVEQRLGFKIKLFYANRTPADAAFLDELDAWALGNPDFKVIATITRPTKAHASRPGHTGYFNDDFLIRHLDNPKNSLHYLCGTPRFVNATRALLLTFDIPEYLIKTDEYEGY